MAIHFTNNSLLELYDLLKLTTTDSFHLNINDFNTALPQLVAITQEKWLRPKGLERWDLVDDSELIKQKEHILKILANLGFTQERPPTLKHYDSVLLLCASGQYLIDRINYVKKIWDKGVRFNRCYLLTAGIKFAHGLSSFAARDVHLNVLPATDTELNIELYKHLSYQWPDDLKKIEVIPVVAEMRLPRPDTRDTILAWAARKEKLKNLLVISNQPFVPYQGLVASSMLEESYYLETVGDQIHSEIAVKISLDAVARCLYEYKNRRLF